MFLKCLWSDLNYLFVCKNNINNSDNNWLPTACMVYDKSITVCGLCKVFGMPGLRIGWLITQNNKLFKKICEFKDYTTICSSMPSEILSIISIENNNYEYCK